MNKRFKLTLVMLSVMVLLDSCATIMSGTKQQVQVTTEPVGARVFVDGMERGLTPCSLEVKRKSSVTYTFKKDGYDDGSLSDKGKFNAVVLVNALLGGLPGAIVDYASGAAYKLGTNIFYTFSQSVARRNDPAIIANEANNTVSRDKPGQTALERTNIRWYFDSDPRGARIFWRVISSIPEVIKNTNELYLTTTPFEETRVFNILGLTYENSRDVTIEIKVSKAGYEDQVKRYNVRQAIDQQEISGFFEMVKK
jgi:hypothetical protein